MRRILKPWYRSVLVAVAALLIGAAYLSGFALATMLTQHKEARTMKKVTGIGGIFFKCKDPKAVTAWYREHLGVDTNPYGATFEWYEGAASTKKGQTQWAPFPETTKYFEPSTRDFMINYRVENLEALVEELKKNGVTIVDTIETVDFGKFIHILDPEGNKVELWEPKD
jgi:predicted enzyme related to lactoylglutathione lyase